MSLSGHCEKGGSKPYRNDPHATPDVLCLRHHPELWTQREAPPPGGHGHGFMEEVEIQKGLPACLRFHKERVSGELEFAE